MASRRGFVLVLVVGVMGLLLLSGVGLLQVAAESQGASRAASSAARARLAAASGMEYAAARLWRIGYPRGTDDPATRGDDWSYRERIETPLEKASNPSFSHGEPWRNLSFPYAFDGIDNDQDGMTDEAMEQNELDDDGDGLVDEPDEGSGIRETVEPYVDLDGDGSFSAFSGRLRGGAAAHASRFSLRVEGSLGKIPVNAGALWEQDHYGGNLNGMGVPDGVPDYNEVVGPTGWPLPYHQGLAHTLNNLGAVLNDLDPALFSTRCEKVPTGDPGNPGDPIWVSWLGNDLIGKRPPGGYRSLDEVRQALVSLGYDPVEIERVIPYLNIGPYEPPQGMARIGSRDPYLDAAGKPIPFPLYVPIELCTIPREVLQAMWMYIGIYVGGDSIPGEPAGWESPCSRTGTLRYNQLNYGREYGFSISYPTCQILFPDEAEKLAEEAARFRKKGVPDWRDLWKALVENAPTIFKRDFDDLDGFPVNQRSWVQAKADVAFRAVCMDSQEFGNGWLGLAAWAAWGIDRDGDPGNATQPHQVSDYVSRLRWPMTFPAGSWRNGNVSPDPLGNVDPFAPFSSPGRPFKMEGLSLAPPAQFTVRSLGAAGPRGLPSGLHWIDGKLVTSDVLEFTSQEDFEALANGVSNALPRYSYFDPNPEARHGPMADPKLVPARSAYSSSATLPRVSRRATTGSVAAALKDFYYGYSPSFGAVGLAPREGGLQNAAMYWPFREDFDFDPHMFAPPAPEGRDYWSETMGWPRRRAVCWDGTGSNPDMYLAALHGNGALWWDPAALMAFDCPGIASPGFINQMSIEFWAFPGSGFNLWGGGAGSSIQLRTRRDGMQASDPIYGTTFDLKISWESGSAVCTQSFPAKFFVPDQAPPISPQPLPPYSTRVSWTYHVVLTFERQIDSTTLVRFYVNGMDAEPETGLPYVHIHEMLDIAPDGSVRNRNGNMVATGTEYLGFSGIDELRIYPGLLGLSEARERYLLERFRRKGTFTSPLHVLPEESAFTSASHNTILPAELYEAADPANPLTDPPTPKLDAVGKPVPLEKPVKVSVVGYETRPGDPLHPKLASGYPAELQSSGSVTDLIGKGKVRSFEYKVELDCERAAGILNDTPVFESLWVALQRPSRTRRWSSWRDR